MRNLNHSKFEARDTSWRIRFEKLIRQPTKAGGNHCGRRDDFIIRYLGSFYEGPKLPPLAGREISGSRTASFSLTIGPPIGL